MNDNDIIKVGECIRGEKVLCLSCPYRVRFPDCRKYVIRDIFDLASRQKAEIERLNKEVDRLSQVVLYHEGDIVDAVKEFAERLKAKNNKSDCPWEDAPVRESDIDEVLKEMGVTVDEAI